MILKSLLVIGSRNWYHIDVFLFGNVPLYGKRGIGVTRTMEIPERICRRVERRIGPIGYTLPMLTVKLYSIWLEGGIELDDEKRARTLPAEYTDIFGMVKDEIDPAAPHDMKSIRRNIARRRKDYAR